jgi:hypothetical protein
MGKVIAIYVYPLYFRKLFFNTGGVVLLTVNSPVP